MMIDGINQTGHSIFTKRTLLVDDVLTAAKRREWMGCWGLLGVAGMIITSDYGSFPKIPCV